MWHLLEKFGRRVARKVDKRYAEYLLEKVGGSIERTHIPAPWEMKEAFDFENVIGYVTNAKPRYTYACIVVTADGKEICRVTRKEDAFRIMQALKRDYKDIVVWISTKH